MLDVDGEVALLVDAITRLGAPDPAGAATVSVPFGVLFRETGDICAWWRRGEEGRERARVRALPLFFTFMRPPLPQIHTHSATQLKPWSARCVPRRSEV